jgi:hypothetical protein
VNYNALLHIKYNHNKLLWTYQKTNGELLVEYELLSHDSLGTATPARTFEKCKRLIPAKRHLKAGEHQHQIDCVYNNVNLALACCSYHHFLCQPLVPHLHQDQQQQQQLQTPCDVG